MQVRRYDVLRMVCFLVFLFGSVCQFVSVSVCMCLCLWLDWIDSFVNISVCIFARETTLRRLSLFCQAPKTFLFLYVLSDHVTISLINIWWHREKAVESITKHSNKIQSRKSNEMRKGNKIIKQFTDCKLLRAAATLSSSTGIYGYCLAALNVQL